MAVRIRMTRLGRRHRPYFRIVAADSRSPRDGKYIEELGTYDPMVPNTDNRIKLNAGRVKYWLGVGAQPTEKVNILLKKYLEKFEKIEAGEAVPAAAPSEPAEATAAEETGS